MNKHSLLSLLVLAAVTGCAADESAKEPSSNEGERSVESVSGQMKKVGSYALPAGSTLDVYEAAPGEIIVGERVPDGAKVADDREAPASLTELYTLLTGNTEVPGELVAAEQRRLALEASSDESATSTRTQVAESAPIPEFDAQTLRGDALKEAPRNVADFRLYHCRDGAPKKTFTYCHTERTGDTSLTKNDIHGSYTAVRPYRGSVTFTVRYNLTGWENAFSVTVDEGTLYRARKVGPVRDYDINSQVSNGEGDGWNLAVIGTDNRGDKGWYGDYTCIAGVCISGSI